MKKNKIRSVRMSRDDFELIKSYGLNVNEAFALWIQREFSNEYMCPTCNQTVVLKEKKRSMK